MSFDPLRLRREFPIFAERAKSGRPFHYLDNAATAQAPDAVIEAVADADRRHRANVARGVYRLAEEATAAFEAARGEIGRYLHAPGDEIVFTGGCTAALNLAALSLGDRLSPGDRAVISTLDHHSNIVPWQLLKARRGIEIVAIPVTEEGGLDLEALARLVGPKTRIIALTHGSNVTGARVDLPRAAALAKTVGALLVVDGAQVAPRGPLDPRALGADLYAVSGHKMFGPTGIGVLWGRRELLADLGPAFGGGGMIGEVRLSGSTWAKPPARFEAGTPPIAQAIGLAAAANWITSLDHGAVEAHLNDLTARLLDGLAALDRQERRIRVIGPPARPGRLAVVSFHVEGLHPHDICQVLDESGACVRGGHHCAQPLMDAFGLAGTTRASLAAYNDAADVDALLAGLERAIEVLA
ncbi:MAG: aminotransferase class V-fold PLP-dependent enzyme [Alphaproteobacteria bacterium]|nr:aminotransferase class V-fold PLP-dependent enzyme [Alphaproteobacteria bacterium]